MLQRGTDAFFAVDGNPSFSADIQRIDAENGQRVGQRYDQHAKLLVKGTGLYPSNSPAVTLCKTAQGH